MKNDTAISITDIRDFVNRIFECHSKITTLQNRIAKVDAELSLVKQLIKGLEIVDSANPFEVK